VKRSQEVGTGFDYVVLNDIPCLAAMTLVAPGVLFNDFAILATPALAFAIVFNVRKSSFDHARRTTFFFLAILAPVVGAAL
jgi:hypothetical protein